MWPVGLCRSNIIVLLIMDEYLRPIYSAAQKSIAEQASWIKYWDRDGHVAAAVDRFLLVSFSVFLRAAGRCLLTSSINTDVTERRSYASVSSRVTSVCKRWWYEWSELLPQRFKRTICILALIEAGWMIHGIYSFDVSFLRGSPVFHVVRRLWVE